MSICAGKTVSVVLCDGQITFVYGEDLSTLDRINAVVDLLDTLRVEAASLCGLMMEELSASPPLCEAAA